MSRLIDLFMHPVSQIALWLSSVVLIGGLIATAPTAPEPWPAPQLEAQQIVPAALPQPTSTPSPWPTPISTATTAATATVPPTATVAPTETPRPSATPWPTDTPWPTATPIRIDAPDAVCPCFAGNVRTCYDFRNQSEAQACYGYCAALGMGDVHGLNETGSGQACDTWIAPTPLPTAVVPARVAPTLWPTIVVPVQVVPTPIPLVVEPAQPAVVCDCSGDIYNCPDFTSGSSAQACFDYCREVGRGDIHRLDNDNDLYACEDLP